MSAPVVEVDEKRIDAIFADVDQCALPGAAVGIAIGGRPVYRKGFGLASIELPLTLSPSMRLRIASTSKHFTCLTYLLLCEEGLVSIDDPIGKFLPELHPVSRRPTMRQLMSNISGLRDVYDIHARFSGQGSPASTPELLALYRDIDDVNAAPGTAWCYNNGGWLLLSEAIERITGQKLERVMWERVFEPIGMYDTLVRRLDTDFVPNSATPHALGRNGGFERRYWDLDNFLGAGSIVSTVDDMLRWLAHMDDPSTGTAATWSLLRSRGRLSNGELTSYGLGLVLERYRGVDTLSHAGNALGGNAQMLKVPSAALDIVVLVNREDINSVLLTERILDVCLSGLESLRPATRQPTVTGVFRSPSTGRILQLYAKEAQQIVSVNGLDLPFEPDADGALHFTRGGKQSVRLIGGLQSPTSLRFDAGGVHDELLAVPRARPGEQAQIVGHYRSNAIDTTVKIREAGAGWQLTSQGRFGSLVYDLEPLAHGLWRADCSSTAGVNGFLCFDEDAGGFRFSSWQTWSLPFRRCT